MGKGGGWWLKLHCQLDAWFGSSMTPVAHHATHIDITDYKLQQIHSRLITVLKAVVAQRLGSHPKNCAARYLSKMEMQTSPAWCRLSIVTKMLCKGTLAHRVVKLAAICGHDAQKLLARYGCHEKGVGIVCVLDRNGSREGS